MLNRKTLVSIIAIVCCADMAFGAASLRIGGTQNATGTTARAGTLRAGSVKLADVTPKSSVSGGTATPTTIGRLEHQPAVPVLVTVMAEYLDMVLGHLQPRWTNWKDVLMH